ncbi:Ig-like domain-containing protein [Variovorax sp. J22R133]|uniref:Ig-like domain-containing protein n=1 Tax=Variovorax brevis TaxID=3053503 RepID=UPI0025783B7F|nr:Ig-like domain-containing protein [Variovorax sp. J22R133]MDM0113705.1 Ig-like domain-containing protein [Variovorax sp. J22R133]
MQARISFLAERSFSIGVRHVHRLTALALLAAVPMLAGAAGVSVKMDFSSPTTSPFPSDRFTRPDWTQNTFKRVNLPKPDCTGLVSDCQDIDVLNTLDGFNMQPRITVPFTGDIDLSTVNSDTLYLVGLGDTLSGRGFGDKVGINQVSWDVANKTLVVQSDELLQEHSRYVLVITNGIHDTAGDPIAGAPFSRPALPWGRGGANDRDLLDFQGTLQGAERAVRAGRHRVVAVSLFTTQSVSADLVKIREQIRRSNPAPINFMIGNGGTTRAAFPVADLGSIQWNRQVSIPAYFATVDVPTQALQVVPGAVGRVAFGTFRSPNYQNADRIIPAAGTLLGHPAALSSNDLVVELFLPSGARPAAGWPVAIFGHGFGDSMFGGPWAVASVFASKGIATIAISAVGHGGGPLGTINVVPKAGGLGVVLPSGGRGADVDGNGVIDESEGLSPVAPVAIVAERDGLRQTVIDLMQLVRQIQQGIDVEGDGSVDIDRNRIYYAGQSLGGIYGTIFLAVEGAVRAGVPNVPGGSLSEVSRLGAFRIFSAIMLVHRSPPLGNRPFPPSQRIDFLEAIPLRNEPPLLNDIPGASAIQVVLDHSAWVQQTGNPVAYAPYLRKQPLPGHGAKPVIVQFMKGDFTVPNPTTTAILRAGDLADRAMYFRKDLAFPATGEPVDLNPHTFLTNIGDPAGAPFAVAAQTQMALFFASDGATVIDPDGAGPLFEMPIALPLPEVRNFPTPP